MQIQVNTSPTGILTYIFKKTRGVRPIRMRIQLIQHLTNDYPTRMYIFQSNIAHRCPVPIDSLARILLVADSLEQLYQWIWVPISKLHATLAWVSHVDQWITCTLWSHTESSFVPWFNQLILLIYLVFNMYKGYEKIIFHNMRPQSKV